MFSFSIKETDNAIEVIFAGDLDIEGTEVVENELIPALNNCQRVNIDFTDVPFVDSSGMGLLLDLVQTLKEKGTIVTITKVSEEVMDVFDLLQIPEILGSDVFV
ncbi:lipid asymmetry maintenance protein MlaB [Anaerobacillus sp. MEB173]|uniref:STAS domain-containing protein n=1 Tax=Anaerobacillus sp. MEB173 TaxID=3383345 RepID=UPI003F921B6D